MLTVDIRRLNSGGIETRGTIPAEDQLFEGFGPTLAGPVEVVGRLQATDGSGYLWRGEIRATLIGECRRCLSRVQQVVADGVDVVFSADEDLADDPSVYPLPQDSATVDVTNAVREELALRAATFPLCTEGCKGLCPDCGTNMNAGSCECAISGNNS